MDDRTGVLAGLVNLPHWTEEPDYFVWEAFDWAARDEARVLGPEAKQQEALLAETKSLYVIPDQFGIVSGHLLVIPKKRAKSVACLDATMDGEVVWFLSSVASVVADVYRSQVVIAEHGDGGCDLTNQAHVHVLPIPKTVTRAGLRAIVDDVLLRRMVGIERITYQGTDFTALEDLQSLINVDGASVIGRQLQCSDLTEHGAYPASTRTATELKRPYVYFRGPGIQFVSPHSFRSQFVREVVSIASSQPPKTWDRRVNTSRSNMFKTFDRLAPAFAHVNDTKYGFKPRVGATQR